MSQIKFVIDKSPRIQKLIDHLYAATPQIEADRAELITESYKMTEALPMVKRRSAAFRHILENIPIVIRPYELIVGSNSIVPRSCQTFPEYSFEWLEGEYDTIATRDADRFYISPETVERLKKVHPYWKGRTVSDLAAQSMDPKVLDVFMNHGIFTVGNYFYNGIGHINVDYAKVIYKGLEGVIAEAKEAMAKLYVGNGDYLSRKNFLESVIESCEAVITYAHRPHIFSINCSVEISLPGLLISISIIWNSLLPRRIDSSPAESSKDSLLRVRFPSFRRLGV